MIKNAIISRIAKSIEAWNFEKFMIEVDKIVIFVWIFWLLFYPTKISDVVLFHRWTIFAWFILLNAYAFFDSIISAFFILFDKLPKITFDFDDLISKKTTISSTKEMIDGISQQDLIEFILKHNWFPFTIARSKFWLFPKDHKKIGDNLERVWILVRGENNARVLKENIDRQTLEEMISKCDSNDLSVPLLQQWNTFTFKKL